MKNETEALNNAIIVLQEKRDKELELINEHLHTTFESLKPINLIKSTLKEASSSSGIKNNILGNAIGIGTGFIIKKLLVGSSHNPVKRLFGTLIQFAIANVVSKHTDRIQSTGINLLHRFLEHRKESKREFHYNGTDLLT